MNSKDLFDLKGAIAVITGGAGILGKQHAQALLDAGGKVVLLDIAEERLKREVKKLDKKYPKRIWGFVLDIKNEKMIRDTVKKINDQVGPISILINNVAHNPPPDKHATGRLENFDLENWNEYIAVGLTGAFLMSKIIGPGMARRKRGVIINIASDLGLIAPDQRIYRRPNLPRHKQPAKAVTYSVVKHGIIGLTKYLATYWAEDGVRVNAISPGGVQTRIAGRRSDKEFVKKLTNLIPLGRMARESEYRAAIIFLCSDASAYMTGSNLIIDGGRTCW